MKAYLSGPMTGLPNHNYEAFNAAAEKLRALGYEVINPAELDEPAGLHNPGEAAWEDYLQRDLRAMLDGCDGLFLLPGWQQSRGAKLELHVARELGWLIVEYEDLAWVMGDAYDKLNALDDCPRPAWDMRDQDRDQRAEVIK